MKESFEGGANRPRQGGFRKALLALGLVGAVSATSCDTPKKPEEAQTKPQAAAPAGYNGGYGAQTEPRNSFGRSSGPHLHFETISDNAKYNPSVISEDPLALETPEQISHHLELVQGLKKELVAENDRVLARQKGYEQEDSGREFEPNPPAIAFDHEASAFQALGQDIAVLESIISDAAECERGLIALNTALEAEEPVGGIGQIRGYLPGKLDSLYGRAAMALRRDNSVREGDPMSGDEIQFTITGDTPSKPNTPPEPQR